MVTSAAKRCGLLGVGGDEVVGLEALQLDGRHVEGPGRLADQGELRDQLWRRRRTVGLVVGIEIVAESASSGIEDHRDVVGVGILQQLQQHVGEAIDRVHRRAVAARHGRQGMEGAEDVARAVDQVDVAWMLGFRHAPKMPERAGGVEDRVRAFAPPHPGLLRTRNAA